MNNISLVSTYFSALENQTDLNHPSFFQNLSTLIQSTQDSLSPDDPLFYLLQGELEFYQQHYEKALKLYLKARPLSESQWLCYRAIAYAEASKGNTSKAEAYLTKVLELFPLDRPSQELFKNLKKTSTSQEPIAMPEHSKISSPLTSKSESQEFETAILVHKQKQQEGLKNYLNLFNERKDSLLDGLYIFDESFLKQDPSFKNFPLSNSISKKGGYYIRWNGKGVVINPGIHFLDAFHKQQFHIRDIDSVIITNSNPESYTDIKRIYDLNADLNKFSSEIKVIHYYVVENAYDLLSSLLKPLYSQEKNTLHRLEFFMDSPDVERLEMHSGIYLNYFSIEKQKKYSLNPTAHLGIRLDLQKEDLSFTRLAFLSQCGWSPFLSHDLSICDILVAGFGHTSVDDYQKLHYNEHSLGFYGVATLIEELNPQVVILTEFDEREGDIRLEVIKKLREESNLHAKLTSIVPGNQGLYLDLKQFLMACNQTKQLVSIEEIRMIKSADAFDPFLYISSDCLI